MSIDLKEYIDTISTLQYALIKGQKCVSGEDFIGKGNYGAVYQSSMVNKHQLVLKLITSNNIDENVDNEKEINMLSACSTFILKKICINFIMMYMAYAVPDHGHDLKKADAGVVMSLEKLTSRNIFKPITYGIVMEKIHTDVVKCVVDHRNISFWEKNFWQIAMALTTIRTHLGYFHNDSHGGNIFLTKINKPCAIVYNYDSRRRIIKLETDETYAVLGDFGLSDKVPALFTLPTVMSDVFTGHPIYNYVSDIQRLITYPGSPFNIPHLMIAELRIIWEEIAEEIRKIIIKLHSAGKITLTIVKGKYVPSCDENGFPRPGTDVTTRRVFTVDEANEIEQVLELEFVPGNTLYELYQEELNIFYKHAFESDVIGAWAYDVIECDMSWPVDIPPILPHIPDCNPASIDADTCLKTNSQYVEKKGSESSQLCDATYVAPVVPPIVPLYSRTRGRTRSRTRSRSRSRGRRGAFSNKLTVSRHIVWGGPAIEMFRRKNKINRRKHMWNKKHHKV